MSTAPTHQPPGRGPGFTPSHVLFATDFSHASASALDVAMAIARQFGAGLSLLHVHAASRPSAVGASVDIPAPGTAMPTEAEQLAAVTARLEGMMAQCRERAVSARTEVVPLNGPVAEAIRTQATRLGADLIVMGTHARTGVGRAVLGSVAEEVLRRAKVPVVVVPPGEES